MEENLEIVETLLNGIEPYFPITDVKTAADAVSYLLLESDGEPNVAVVTLLMCLVKEAVLQSPQDRKKLIVNDRLIFMSPIPLTTFRETWNSFLMIVKDVNKTVAQKTSRGRRAAETSPATIIAIYKFITERVAVGNEKSTIGGRSGMLHFISATENPPKNLRGSRAFLDFSEVKELTVMISQLLGLTDVHLNLSESMVFVGIGKPDELGKNLVGIPEHESGFLPRGSRSTAFAGLPPVTDLWVCSKGQFVDCDRFLEIAYLCTAMQQDYTADGFNEVLGEFQLLVLNILYADHKMNKFPMGLTIYGILESFINEKQSGNKSVVEKLLRQAIRTNQDNYANAFVFPYCYFVKYLIRTEEYVTALVPAELASSAACQYAYVSNLDQVLYKGEENLNFIWKIGNLPGIPYE